MGMNVDEYLNSIRARLREAGGQEYVDYFNGINCDVQKAKWNKYTMTYMADFIIEWERTRQKVKRGMGLC